MTVAVTADIIVSV